MIFEKEKKIRIFTLQGPRIWMKSEAGEENNSSCIRILRELFCRSPTKEFAKFAGRLSSLRFQFLRALLDLLLNIDDLAALVLAGNQACSVPQVRNIRVFVQSDSGLLELVMASSPIPLALRMTHSYYHNVPRVP
jgi:hypothetical protein